MTDRFDFIDSLRGIAICSVFVNHTHSILKSNSESFFDILFTAGHYGVQLFFVISAFTIFLSYHKSKEFEKSPIRVFFVKRLFRIVPLYWLGIILYSVVYGLGSRGWLPGPELWHIPVHVFLLNNLHPLTTSSVVPGGWSISCEVLFYVLIPVLVYLINSTKKAILFIVSGIVISPIIINYLRDFFYFSFQNYSEELVSHFWYRSLIHQIICFGFGILFYFIYRSKLIPEGKVFSFIYLLLSSIILFYTVFVVKYKFYSDYLISFGFLLMAVSLSKYSWKLIENKFFRFMGKISYSVYLIHFLVINQLYKVLISLSFNLSKTSIFIILLLISFLVTISLSYLTYLFVESFFITKGKQLNKFLNIKNYAH